MKTLIPLILLASLVSCNDSIGRRSTITNNNEVVQKYQAGLTAERGLVSNSQKAGSEIAMDFVNNKIVTTKVNERSRAVILHVDGESIYRFVETRNVMTGSLTKKVVLEISNPQKELRDLLNSNRGMLSQDTLILKGTNFHERDLEGVYKISSAETYTSSFNLYKSLCESTNLISTENRIMNNEGEEITVTTTLNETSVCGTKFTNKQLKEIDLKSIMYCSTFDDDESECKTAEDLSWLTSDL